MTDTVRHPSFALHESGVLSERTRWTRGETFSSFSLSSNPVLFAQTVIKTAALAVTAAQSKAKPPKACSCTAAHLLIASTEFEPQIFFLTSDIYDFSYNDAMYAVSSI